MSHIRLYFVFTTLKEKVKLSKFKKLVPVHTTNSSKPAADKATEPLITA